MKSSWTDVVSFISLLVFALIMAKGWPNGDWAFGWGAVGALATIVLGAIAAHISNTQKTWLAEKRAADTDRITNDLGSAIADAYMTFVLLRSDLKDLQYDDISGLKYWAPRMGKSSEGIASILRRDTSYLLGQGAHKKASALNQRLEAFCFLLDGAIEAHDATAQRDTLEKLAAASDSILEAIDEALGVRGSAIRDMFSQYGK